MHKVRVDASMVMHVDMFCYVQKNIVYSVLCCIHLNNIVEQFAQKQTNSGV